MNQEEDRHPSQDYKDSKSSSLNSDTKSVDPRKVRKRVNDVSVKSVHETRSVSVSGNLQKSIVVTGNNNHIKQIIQLYKSKVESGVDDNDLQRQIREYLVWVKERFGTVELRGIHREGHQVIQLNLETMYVPLTAISGGGNREINLSNILGLGTKLIVTGGPGSGKTTVLQHIAWTLANALIVNRSSIAAQNLGLKIARGKQSLHLPLPIFVPLSAYAQSRLRNSQQDRTLATFITYYLIEKQSALNLPKDFFAQLLDSGKGVILLLDGLDEVPDEHERIAIREAIENLVTGRPNLWVIVTCRTAAYRNRTALGKGFLEVFVKPLDESHIEALVEQAYSAIYPSDVTTRQTKVNELLVSIRNMESERRQRLGNSIERLIDSPLMVRMLLIVHLSERHLPEHRAELYMRTTDTMLWPEHTLDEEASERIGRLIGGSHELHREIAQHVAFSMHQRGPEQGREIEEQALKVLLTETSEFTSLISDFLALTRLRGTLLEERMGVYRFVHLAFQEYLTARYLAEVVRGEGGIEAIAKYLENGPIMESWWREPALLVTGYLSLTSPRTARQLLLRLANPNGHATSLNDLQMKVHVSALEIASISCLEWLSSDLELRSQLAKPLARVLEDKSMPNLVRPIKRAMLGNILAQFGDPRQGVGTLNGIPSIEWRHIAEGQFISGEAGEDYSRFFNGYINRPYYISRYLITVMQYQAFIEVQGYEQEKYWTEEGWAWRQFNRVLKPENYGQGFGICNHPQVGISWYEAVAFCSWLSENISLNIRLPTETEWERASRHTDGRNYPWGNNGRVEEFCNMQDTRINETTSVGIFPHGDSNCGAADMSGNVLEWCNTRWSPNYTKTSDQIHELSKDYLSGSLSRVVRGGSFGNSTFGVRCAYRSKHSPESRYNNLGFRVVVFAS